MMFLLESSRHVQRILAAVFLSVGFGVGVGFGFGKPGSAAEVADSRTCPCVQVLYQFGSGTRGTAPDAPVTDVDDVLYGIAPGGDRLARGVVYALRGPDSEKVLHRFTGFGDGAYPAYGGLIAVHGVLYGMTFGGGKYRMGTIFEIGPGRAETVIYSFGSRNDGAGPSAGLTYAHGVLYGTTSSGGTHGFGTVFGITPSGVEMMRFDFAGGRDGAYPASTLVERGGMLYGTTIRGGLHDAGTVFAVTLGGREAVLHVFGEFTPNAYPAAGLTELHGAFYGTTTSGAGTVYRILPDGEFVTLHNFGSPGDSGRPANAQLVAANGALYGVNIEAGHGKNGFGSIYSITATGDEKTLYRFPANAAEGVFPTSLTFADGNLYGTTEAGGAFGGGTIYRLKL